MSTTALFDLDGTLIDSVRLILDSYHHTLAAHGLPPQTDDFWLAGLGTPLRTQFAAFAHTQEEMDALVTTYRAYNNAHHDTLVTVYPGVVAMVEALVARGVRLGVVTSKQSAGARRGLKLAGLDGAFSVVIGADDVVNAKPHPEPVFRALAALGTPNVREAVFVGDAIHDLHAGRAAGVRTVGVLWGPFSAEALLPAAPDHLIDTPSARLDLL